MERKVLLFGFNDLPVLLAASAAAGPLGVTVKPVHPRDCALTVGELAEGKTAPESTAPTMLQGRMALLCNVEDCMEALLPALRQAGIVCPKAVLTGPNRSWKPEKLMAELYREQAAFRKKG